MSECSIDPGVRVAGEVRVPFEFKDAVEDPVLIAVIVFRPQLWGSFGMPVQEPLMHRLVSAAVLAFTGSSWWAYTETLWDKIKIVVQKEIVWTVLAAIQLGRCRIFKVL